MSASPPTPQTNNPDSLCAVHTLYNVFVHLLIKDDLVHEEKVPQFAWWHSGKSKGGWRLDGVPSMAWGDYRGSDCVVGCTMRTIWQWPCQHGNRLHVNSTYSISDRCDAWGQHLTLIIVPQASLTCVYTYIYYISNVDCHASVYLSHPVCCLFLLFSSASFVCKAVHWQTSKADFSDFGDWEYLMGQRSPVCMLSLF